MNIDTCTHTYVDTCICMFGCTYVYMNVFMYGPTTFGSSIAVVYMYIQLSLILHKHVLDNH